MVELLKTHLVLITASYIFSAPYASAEIGENTAEIMNASWQEVPDTAGTEPGYTDSAYININSISRKGNLVIFDVVNSDVSYARVEGNCRKNQFRPLRQGEFLSATRVSYQEHNENEPWAEANSYQIELISFACNRVPQNQRPVIP